MGWNPFKKPEFEEYRPPGFYDKDYYEKKWHSGPDTPVSSTPPLPAGPPSYQHLSDAHDAIARDRARAQQPEPFRAPRAAAPKAPPSVQKQHEPGD